MNRQNFFAGNLVWQKVTRGPDASIPPSCSVIKGWEWIDHIPGVAPKEYQAQIEKGLSRGYSRDSQKGRCVVGIPRRSPNLTSPHRFAYEVAVTSCCCEVAARSFALCHVAALRAAGAAQPALSGAQRPGVDGLQQRRGDLRKTPREAERSREAARPTIEKVPAYSGNLDKF